MQLNFNDRIFLVFSKQAYSTGLSQYCTLSALNSKTFLRNEKINKLYNKN